MSIFSGKFFIFSADKILRRRVFVMCSVENLIFLFLEAAMFCLEAAMFCLQVQGAVDSLFTAWCPKQLWKNSVFSEDFEGEQSDYYPGAVDKEQGAFCGRQSMRNAWRLYPINRAKTGRISMKRNLYVSISHII